MKNKKFTLPYSYYNTISYLGTFIAGISFIVIIFLVLFSEIFGLGSSIPVLSPIL
jgi:hypothetical protein